MIDIRNLNTAPLVFFAAVICVFSALFCSASGNLKLSPKPSHTVLREWKASNGRRFDVAGAKICESMALRTVLQQDGGARCMMIKSSNLAITVYTRGKVIYSCEDRGLRLCGTRVTVIPLSDVKRGEEITLYLEPRGKGGEVISPIYIGINNDMMLTVISREKRSIYAVFALCTDAIFTAAKLLLAKRKTAPLLCLLGAELSLIIAIICNCDAAQFFIGSSLARLVLHHSFIVVTPILSAAYAVLTFIQKRLPQPYCR